MGHIPRDPLSDAVDFAVRTRAYHCLRCVGDYRPLVVFGHLDDDLLQNSRAKKTQGKFENIGRYLGFKKKQQLDAWMGKAISMSGGGPSKIIFVSNQLVWLLFRRLKQK